MKGASMNALRIVFTATTLVLASIATSAVHAQLNRTAVSGKGDDANNCSPATPCRTFARAISQTNAFGEIIVLDSAGYGPFSINHPVTVQAAPGIYAGITAATGHAIELGPSAGTVVLRGLTLTGSGVADNFGIYGFATIIHVENCVIDGFDTGIIDGAYELTVSDSEVRNNVNAGIIIANTGVKGVIERVRLKNNGNFGLVVQDHATASVRNSVAANHSGDGFGGIFFSVLNIENSESTHSSTGIYSDSSATVRVSNTFVTDNNSSGLRNTAVGTMQSWGNNKVRGNGTDTLGTIGSLPLQ